MVGATSSHVLGSLLRRKTGEASTRPYPGGNALQGFSGGNPEKEDFKKPRIKSSRQAKRTPKLSVLHLQTMTLK